MAFNVLEAVRNLGENSSDRKARSLIMFYMTVKALRRRKRDADFEKFVKTIPLKVKE